MKSIFHEETDSEWSVDLSDPKNNRRFIQVPRKPVGTGQSKLRDPDLVTTADGKVVECFPFTNDPLPPVSFSTDESPYREENTPTPQPTPATADATNTSVSPSSRPGRSFSVSRKPVQFGIETPPTRTRGYTESDIGSTSIVPSGHEGMGIAGSRPKPKHVSVRDSKADLSKALSKIGIKPGGGSSRDLPTDPDELQAAREEHIRDSYAALERVRDSKAVHEFYAGGGKITKTRTPESRSNSKEPKEAKSKEKHSDSLSRKKSPRGPRNQKREIHVKTESFQPLDTEGVSDDPALNGNSDSDSDSDLDTQSLVKLPSASMHPVFGVDDFSSTPYATPFETTPATESASTFGLNHSRSRTPTSSQLLDQSNGISSTKSGVSPTKSSANVVPKRVPVDHPSLHTNPDGRFLIDSCPELELKREVAASIIPAPKGYKYPIDDRFPITAPRQASPPIDRYQEFPEPYDCWNEQEDRKGAGSAAPPPRHPFYRYFVMRFSRDLYLTTTPTLHHLVANPAQSYYVRNDDYKFMFYTNINEEPVTIVERRENFLQISYDDSSKQDIDDADPSCAMSLEQSIDSQSLHESLSDIVNPTFVGQAIEIPCGDKPKHKKHKRYSFIDELGQEWFIANEKSGTFTFSNANSVLATYKRKENIGKRIVKNGLEWLSQQESNSDNYRAHPSSGPQPVASSIETDACAVLTVSERVDPASNLWKICIGLLVAVAYKKPKS